MLERHLNIAAQAGVALVEQPLPAGRDALLAEIRRPLLVCADESVHHTGDLASLADRYDAINIKLDKTGGLTEALAMKAEAERLGFSIMTSAAPAQRAISPGRRSIIAFQIDRASL